MTAVLRELKSAAEFAEAHAWLSEKRPQSLYVKGLLETALKKLAATGATSLRVFLYSSSIEHKAEIIGDISLVPKAV